MLTAVRRLTSAASALLSTLMLGVAAGVVWLVATLYFHQPPAWYAPVVGVLLAWALRVTTRTPGVTCATVAVLATLLAALCVNVTLVGLELAGSMGLTLREALRSAGAGMLWELVRLSLSASVVAWYGAGAILAAGIALPRMQH